MTKPHGNPDASGGYPSRGHRSGNDQGHERGTYPSRGFGGGHGYRGDGSGSWVGYGRDNDSHAASQDDEASWGGYGRDRDDR
jgi:hypothetical protein